LTRSVTGRLRSKLFLTGTVRIQQSPPIQWPHERRHKAGKIRSILILFVASGPPWPNRAYSAEIRASMHKSPTIIYVSSKVADVIEAGLQKSPAQDQGRRTIKRTII